jgi:hypothetical protein
LTPAETTHISHYRLGLETVARCCQA